MLGNLCSITADRRHDEKEVWREGGEEGGVMGGGVIIDVLRARTGWGWVGWEVKIERK